MKRKIAFLLLLVMVIGNTAAYAAPDDIIHTGLKKVYTKTLADQEELLQDILNGVDKNKFYREIVDGKYINIIEEEDKHLEKLQDIFKNKGISNPNDMQKYVLDNEGEIRQQLSQITEDIATSFDGIDDKDKGKIDDYIGANNALILNSNEHYSIPVPGSKEGTTRISILNLPTNAGASKWMVKLEDNPVSSMPKDTELNDGMEYIKDKDIEVESGKYLILYAVDRTHRIKGYANIKITPDMIRQPREEAVKLGIGKVEKGKVYAGAMIIEGLSDDNLPEGADKWQVSIRNTPIDNVYEDDKIEDAVNHNMDDIVVATEGELSSIDDGFKKYVLLLATDDDGKVKGYRIFEIKKEDISMPPIMLKEGSNYEGPIAGTKDGTTEFTRLDTSKIEGATTWKAVISKDRIAIPILNQNIGENIVDPLTEMEASAGNYLLLAATDDNGKIKGYKIFKLEYSQIKGKTADELSITPTKGSAQGTTKIDTLDLSEITGATKWMYKIGESLPKPPLDKTVDESINYTQGKDIKAKVGETLLIMATDDEGKVKAFARIELTEEMIKDPPPVLLKDGIHYSKPIKGEKDGTTKVEVLAATESIKDAEKWMYSVDDTEFNIPEMNGTIPNAKDFKAGDSIGDNLKEGQYLMILATDGDSKIKGYANIRLNESQIKMPNAKLLPNDNYSTPEPGTTGGTTKIDKLNLIGIDENATEWRYIVLKEEYPTPLEANSVIDRTSRYTAGTNIRANEGGYLLLLATDNRGRVKAYVQIELKEEYIRNPNAPLLKPIVNYKEPEPGTKANSTKFSFLSYEDIDDAIQWMYMIGNKSFGLVELNSKVDGAKKYNVDDNIETHTGDYLLLLAADGEDNVKAYKEFMLTDKNVRGGEVPKLTDINYALERGSKSGTTKFSKLEFYGVNGASRWKYNLIDKPLDTKPHMNSIVEGSIFYNLGQDIQVKEISSGKYGYILLLAVDNGGKTRGYAEIPIDKNVVKEHAPTLNVQLKEGNTVDSITFNGDLSTGTLYKYTLTNSEYPTPAIDEELKGGIEYKKDEDITKVRIGQYINLFEIDKDNKIKAYISIEIKGENIKQGKASMTNASILEGNIVNGGEKIEITLEGAKWTEDIKTNENKRNALYYGFKPSSEIAEWNKVVNKLIADGSGAIFRDSDTKLAIILPEVKDYDINKDQIINLTIPAVAIEDAINPIESAGSITIKPTVKATISGDVVNSIVREKDIKAGGKTIVVELEDGSWVADVNNIIDGFEVVGTGTKWNEIKTKIDSSHIRRNDSRKITITLPPMDIDFGTAQETIKLTIPKELIENAETEVVASPTFTLYPNILEIKAKAVDSKNSIILEAPDGKIPVEGKNIWIIEVTTGTLKDEIKDSDIVVSGLPRGLKANIDKVEGNKITIKVSGSSATSINNSTVKIKVKGKSVTEPNSMDSNDVELKLKVAEKLDLFNIGYKIKDGKIYLVISGLNAEDMEYSTDSTNGINGNWYDISGDLKVFDKLEPVRIWVREKSQPKVFREIVDLKYGNAPEGISISKVNYVEEDKKVVEKVELTETKDTMEYSIDGGNTWRSMEFTITLDENSDLRVRYKSLPNENGTLPSQSTKRLNGLYLGNIELNAGEGKITNTNTTMEYSLNSTNGSDGNWTAGRSNETLVNFTVDNKVWIRERGNRENKRNLGTIGQESQPNVDSISYSITGESITNVNNKLEYRIANGNWTSIECSEITDIEFSPGKLEFRTKGTTIKLPSTPVEKAAIKAPAAAPELKIDDSNKIIYYFDETWKTLDDNYQYRIGSNGEWKNGANFKKDEKKNENIVVYVRKSATSTELPSLEKSITFTKNLDFDSLIEIDVAEGCISGTTNNMEYSIDSTNGIDGKWTAASNGKTKITFTEDMNIWIREKGKPSIKSLIAEDIKKENKPDKNSISYDISSGKVSNSTQQNLEFRIAGEAWQRLDGDLDIYEIEFKAGKFEFRNRATKDKLASDITEKAVIKAPVSAPIIEWDDVENIVTSINGISDKWDNFEYRVNGSHWKMGELLKGEELSGSKLVEIRVKATPTELPSQIANIKFTTNLPLEHIRLSTHVHPFELNGTTTQMEYMVKYKDLDAEKTSEWFDCTNENTKLSDDIDEEKIIEIWVRDKKQTGNEYKVWSNS